METMVNSQRKDQSQDDAAILYNLATGFLIPTARLEASRICEPIKVHTLTQQKR